MAPLFRRTQVWVVEFIHDGRRRRWLKPLPQGTEAWEEMRKLLRELYGTRATLVEARPATEEEELAYVHGKLPGNALCPTGREPRGKD